MELCALFDVDGTLIDAGRAGSRAMAAAFAEVYGIENALAGVRFDGMTDLWIVDQAAGRNGMPPVADGGRGQDHFFRVYLKHLHHQVHHRARSTVHPGIRRLLDTLAADGRVTLGLATGNIEAGAREKLSPHDLNRYFPVGGFGDDRRDRAELTRLAAERAGAHRGGPFPPECVVVIGDSVRDVAAARDNGYRSVAVASGYTPYGTLEDETPDALFRDFGDVERAAAAIFSFRDGGTPE